MPYKDPERAKEAHKAWRKANPSKLLEQQRRYRVKNREKVNEKSSRWRKNNPEKFLASIKKYQQANKDKLRISRKKLDLMKSYGLSIEQYQEMIVAQGGRCKICQELFGDNHFGKPMVDHCHSTSKVRGILCGGCNSVLGYAKDSVEILSAAIFYLK